jgi:hypothetical protein
MNDGFDDSERFNESGGFDESEGWWAVGAHLLVIVIITTPVTIVAQFLLSIPFVRSELPLALGIAVGVPAAHRVFRRGRRRYLDWRQDRSGSTPDGR